MLRSDLVRSIFNIIKHEEVIEIYNSQKSLPRGYKLQIKDPWCAATVTASLMMIGYNELNECSCSVMRKKAKDLGLWHNVKGFYPKPGDIIMYDWNVDDNPDHTGIVVSWPDKDDIIQVREGNKNNDMGNRFIKINAAYVKGYIRLEWEDDVMNQIQEGDQGKLVAIWQLIVGAHPDGIFETNTKKATIQFQKDHGLNPDGIVGEKSWMLGLKSINN